MHWPPYTTVAHSTHSGQKLSQQHCRHTQPTAAYQRGELFCWETLQHCDICIGIPSMHKLPTSRSFSRMLSSCSATPWCWCTQTNTLSHPHICIIAICGIRGIRVPRSKASAMCNLYRVYVVFAYPGELNTQPSPTAGHGLLGSECTQRECNHYILPVELVERNVSKYVN